MKTDTHPTFYPNATVTCACGNVVVAGSTIEKQKTDICSACHPFYTGKQKLVDTAGRVDKFKAKMKAKEEHDSKQNNKGKEDDGDNTTNTKPGEKYMTISQMKALKEKAVKKTAAKKKPATKAKKSAKK